MEPGGATPREDRWKMQVKATGSRAGLPPMPNSRARRCNPAASRPGNSSPVNGGGERGRRESEQVRAATPARPNLVLHNPQRARFLLLLPRLLLLLLAPLRPPRAIEAAPAANRMILLLNPPRCSAQFRARCGEHRAFADSQQSARRTRGCADRFAENCSARRIEAYPRRSPDSRT